MLERSTLMGMPKFTCFMKRHAAKDLPDFGRNADNADTDVSCCPCMSDCLISVATQVMQTLEHYAVLLCHTTKL